MNRKLFVPVIVGTARKGRSSGRVADFIIETIGKEYGDRVETTLIDPCDFDYIPGHDHPTMTKAEYQAIMEKADGLYIVNPEYNHSFPGELKYLLDSVFKSYNRKAVGLCGVSSGPWGGSRGIQSLLPVMRELGLLTSSIDYLVNFYQRNLPCRPTGT
jgi:NAD(P)H-dependent FMN reductase